VEYNTKKPHSALGSKSIFTAHGCDIKTLSLLLGLKPWLGHADTNEIAGNYPATQTNWFAEREGWHEACSLHAESRGGKSIGCNGLANVEAYTSHLSLAKNFL
jgi:hypothetical protein